MEYTLKLPSGSVPSVHPFSGQKKIKKTIDTVHCKNDFNGNKENKISMPLKYKYKTKDEIPVEHQAFYEEPRETTGFWTLAAEGVAEQAKLEAAEHKNEALKKQFDSLALKFKNIDPDLARQLLQAKKDAEDQVHLQKGNIDALLEDRVRVAKAEFEGRLTVAEKQRAQLEQQLADLTINQAAIAAASKRGLKTTATTDLVARAKTAFRLTNGQLTAIDPKTGNLRLSPDGTSPLTLDTWVESLLSEAPHLFAENAGSGASGTIPGNPKHTGKNPFQPGPNWNLTQQTLLEQSNPQLAATLRGGC